MGVSKSVKFPGGNAGVWFGLALLVLSPVSGASEFELANERLWSEEHSVNKNALAIAAADFNGDGIEDLAVSFALEQGSEVTVFRGRRNSRLTAAASPRFSEPLTTQQTSWPATRLLTGDFDADGHLDLLAAREGETTVQPLLGDGQGSLRFGKAMAFPGEITAITSGEVNRRDGLADLVVSVVSNGEALAMVYQSGAGVLAADPIILPIPAAAEALALGEIDGDLGIDVVIAAGNDLVMLRGRDMRLAGGVTEDDLEIWQWDEALLDLKIGDYLPGQGAAELAVLDASGRLAYLALNQEAKASESKRTVSEGFQVVRETWLSADPSSRIQPAGFAGDHEELLVFNSAGSMTLVGVQTGKPEERAIAEKSWALEAFPEQLLPLGMNGSATSELLLLSSEKPTLSLLRQKGGGSIVVNSAADTATAGDSDCTLREAINNANADADTTGGDCSAGGGTEVITFSIGSGTVETIALTSALPDVTSPIVLDASSQCATPPCIVLDGSGIAADNTSGLVLLGGSSTVRGLVVNGFSGDGIALLTLGGNLIVGNYIGTNAAGDAAVGLAGNGVIVRTDNNVIGGRTAADRNVIGGLTRAGVAVIGGSGNRIEGNYLGLDVSGTQAIPNAEDAGVLIGNASGNTVGGTDPGAGNVSSGNRWGVGVRRFSDTADATVDNLVQGNLVGTNAAGTAAIGNDEQGIFIFDAPNNTIGGTTPAARNVVAGNGLDGDFAPYAGVQVFPLRGFDSSGNTIQGNYIGTNAAGDTALPNASEGVLVLVAGGTQIGGTAPGAGNLISGNTSAGISIPSVGSADNVIQGNRVGTDANGTVAIPNTGQGIYLENAVGTLIGGTEAGAGNLLSGNNGFGLQINPNANNTTVQGNLIGTTADGQSALPNTSTGIFVSQATGHTIGGTAAGARNVVSGNAVHGIQLFDDIAGSVVQGNYVGLDAAGTGGLGNGEVGVFLGDRSTGNTIGGTEPGAANVVSDNGTWGVFAGSAGVDNVILGNLIGTDASGSGSFGNDVHGIFLFATASQTIGGSLPGAGNTIVGNGTNGIAIGGNGGASNDNVVQGNTIRDNVVHGVAVNQGTGNLISQNSLVNNGGLAIELNGDGPSANDPQDADTGANNLQNFPELDGAQPGSTIISGTLNSAPDTMFTVEFFSSTDCQMQEAGTFLESIQVTTDGNGDADVSATLTATVPEGQGITATATDPDGNTSELSACVPVAGEVIFANGFEETL
ncbi:MAG: FG-GAP-like repeat-containing protein [Pseudomonadota bacterium]